MLFIQDYGHIASVSFSILTNIYSILVKQQNDTDVIWLQHQIHYKHFATCYDADIESTEKKF